MSLRLDKSGLDRLVQRLDNPLIKQQVMDIPKQKGTAALVAEAIADNFNQEGPGWKPLKAQTIRQSVSKKALKASRKPGAEPARRILRKSGLLFGSVTTPGIRNNIWRTEGTTLIWGTDLVYAAIHNRGGIIKHPGTANGFGQGIKIPPHKISIPKREFLTIRAEWMAKLTDFVADKAFRILRTAMFGGSPT